MAKTSPKTVPSSRSVADFVAEIDDTQQRSDTIALIELMRDVTSHEPVLWGQNIIGFDEFTYKYASGRTGTWMKIGFSPRKGMISLYITVDVGKLSAELNHLGKHKTGKGCIYIKRLADVDRSVLRRMIEYAYEIGYMGDRT